MRRFLVCLHDATPAYARETRAMIGELEPLLGRRVSVGVVPDWNGEWPLTAHPGFCRLVRESADELLLHGYFHRRQRGSGMVTWLAEGSDEMNGLDGDETRRTVERGQRVFTEVFGEPARGFLPPAWQRGHVGVSDLRDVGVDHIVGFFSVESAGGRSVPLATFSWDCGRWGWLGNVGHGIGWLRDLLARGIPVVAIHPRDLARGFWPRIVGLTKELLEEGYQPTTVAGLLEANGVAGLLGANGVAERGVEIGA